MLLSKPLMKKTIKDNWKFWAIITAVLCLFMIMMVAMASNVGSRAADRGGNFDADSIVTQFYSMFAVLLPMVYIVLTGNKLIAAQVDRGSFGYIMANPVKRNQVSLTQALFLIGSVIGMFMTVAIIGLIMIAATGISIATGSFLLLNLGVILLLLAISGISYLASCIFNLSRRSLAVGAGIPIVFYLFSMLASFSSLLDVMGYFRFFTINTLFNIDNIMASSTNMIWQFLILAGIAAACYAGGILYFKKKDLPL